MTDTHREVDYKPGKEVHKALPGIEKTVTRICKTTLTINNPQSLISAISNGGLKIPADAYVYFQVPGGASYSGELLEITSSSPLIIQWTETVHE
jgi:hypothetical protein